MAALERLDVRAFATEIVEQLLPLATSDQDPANLDRWHDPDVARRWIGLFRALYEARDITAQQYALHSIWPVERIHEERIIRGDYEAELRPITTAIDAVRKEAGLHDDEFWLVGEGPLEYQQLEERYNEVADSLFVSALREFDLDEFADMREQQPRDFQRLRERGRRTVFASGDQVHEIRDFVVRHEIEATRAAKADAYSAAIAATGAAVEGILILRCLRSPHKAARVAAKMPRSQRPRDARDPASWTFEQLTAVCRTAGWLPAIDTTYGKYDPAGLAGLLRRVRNQVHPGRHFKDSPWSVPVLRDYEDARDIFLILRAALKGPYKNPMIGTK